MLLIVKTKRGIEVSCECGRVLGKWSETNMLYQVLDELDEPCDQCGLSPLATFVRGDKLLPKKPPGVITTASGVPGDGVNASPGFVLPACADRKRCDGCFPKCSCLVCGIHPSRSVNCGPDNYAIDCKDAIERGECPKGWTS